MAELPLKGSSVRYLIAWRVFAFALLEPLPERLNERLIIRGVQRRVSSHPICPLKKRVTFFLTHHRIGYGKGIGSKYGSGTFGILNFSAGFPRGIRSAFRQNDSASRVVFQEVMHLESGVCWLP